jgi:hypothetical protein
MGEGSTHLLARAVLAEDLAEQVLGQILNFSSWPCRGPSTTSLNVMVSQEKYRWRDEGFPIFALSLRPIVVDGRLRGHDEKEDFNWSADKYSTCCNIMINCLSKALV